MGRLKRRFPRASEVARFVGPTFRRSTADRWSRVRTVADFHRLARGRTPRSVFDYVEGAAELELSRDRAVEAFTRSVFHPHVLRDVSNVDTTTTILGRTAALPVVLGPTGFTRMMHAAGEPAVARAAGRAGVPYVLFDPWHDLGRAARRRGGGHRALVSAVRARRIADSASSSWHGHVRADTRRWS